MARYFKEQDIDEFRECFYLYARNGQIRTMDELTIIMRSLGFSPSIRELDKYYKEKNGKISFADFLEIVHNQTRIENIPQEITDAFVASDVRKTGTIPSRELRRILTTTGEKLSPKEVDKLFKEANIPQHGSVHYDDFIRIISAPMPDYY